MSWGGGRGQKARKTNYRENDVASGLRRNKTDVTEPILLRNGQITEFNVAKALFIFVKLRTQQTPCCQTTHSTEGLIYCTANCVTRNTLQCSSRCYILRHRILCLVILAESRVTCPCRIIYMYIYIYMCVCVCVCVCVWPVSDIGTIHFISTILVRTISSHCYLTILIHVFLIVPYNPPLFAHLSSE